MDRDWKRLGRAVAQAREDLGLTQDELAAAVPGVSRGTIQFIEQGKGFRSVPKSVRRLAGYFGWPDGAVERLLAGQDLGDGTVGTGEALDRPRFARGLSRRFIEEIGDGEVLEDLILELAGATPHTSVLLVVKRDEGAPDDDESVRADLRQWSRVRKRIEQVVRDDVESPESA